MTKCQAGGCHKNDDAKRLKKELPTYSCIKCQLQFCFWHLLFLADAPFENETSSNSVDAKDAQCICCFFSIERTSAFRDPAVADNLAKALLTTNTTFRDRVFEYRRQYEESEVQAFSDNGEHYWHPGMAPPPDKDIYRFIKDNR